MYTYNYIYKLHNGENDTIKIMLPDFEGVVIHCDDISEVTRRAKDMIIAEVVVRIWKSEYIPSSVIIEPGDECNFTGYITIEDINQGLVEYVNTRTQRGYGAKDNTKIEVIKKDKEE